MKNKTICRLLPGVSMWGATASAAQSAITRDGECLRGFRQDIIGDRDGVASADVVVEESGARCQWWYASRSSRIS